MHQPAVVRKLSLHAAHAGCFQRRTNRQRLDPRPPVPGVASAGEFDCSNCADLVARVDKLCRQRGRRIRIDLGAVTFIDAAAVGAFLRARHRARTLGCEVVLGSVHGLPLRVLQILGVDTLLIEHEGLHE
jgi:anti-anti-sigma factor